MFMASLAFVFIDTEHVTTRLGLSGQVAIQLGQKLFCCNQHTHTQKAMDEKWKIFIDIYGASNYEEGDYS